jgi:MFS family permease
MGERRPFYDGYTLHHHLRAVVGQGAVAGVLLLNEVIARKGLGASRWHVLALLLAPALAQSVAAIWNPTDPRRLLGRAPFRALGIPSRALLLLPLLAPFLRFDTAFVVVVAASTAVDSLMLPVQNWTLSRNYAPASRGRRFGLASAVQAAAIIAVVLPAGWLLDRQPDAWPWLYAAAGLAGVYGYVHWSRMRRRVRRRAAHDAALEDHGSAWQALRNDRTFLAFEACFMVYGLGFLMLQPVLPIYLVDELHVTYSQVGIARGLLFWLGMVIASPLLGRLGDHVGTFRMTALSFLALTAFPLILLFAPGTGGLYAGYGAYGLAMGGVAVAWNVGPIVIARGRDPLPYLNAHVALVGVRALVGMVAGVWIQQSAGTAPVFWCVVVLELLAAFGMWLVARRAEPA